MPDVSLGRFSRFAEKLFNVKGGPQLVDVFPTIQIAQLLDIGVDGRYLQSWDRFQLASNILPSAGNLSGQRIRNPPGSGVIAVMEHIAYAYNVTDNGGALFRGTSTTDLANGVAGTLRQDPRGRPNPTCIVSNQNNAPTLPALTGSTAVSANVALASTLVQLISNPNQEMVLLPGDALQIGCGAVNEQLLVNFWWRERALESSELT